MLFPILHNRIRSGGYQRETLNKKKIRLSLAVALTALLFTMYYLILDYFETPAWIPLLVFVFLLGLLAAVCIWLPRVLPPGGKKVLGKVRP